MQHRCETKGRECERDSGLTELDCRGQKLCIVQCLIRKIKDKVQEITILNMFIFDLRQCDLGLVCRGRHDIQ